MRHRFHKTAAGRYEATINGKPVIVERCFCGPRGGRNYGWGAIVDGEGYERAFCTMREAVEVATYDAEKRRVDYPNVR